MDAITRLGQRVAAAGLVVGAGGNISIRTGHDEIVITPSGHCLDDLAPGDVVVVDLDGRLKAGSATPSSELSMHLAAHRARPDTAVALHLHPAHANVLAATGHPVRLITTDHAYYVRHVVQVPYLHPGTDELAQAVAEGLGAADVVLLTHHGCLLVAPDVDLAFERAVNLEAAAAATFRALALGDTSTVCPPQFLERILALEAAAGGPVYGKDATRPTTG
ncbi:MAG: class II aldolase/adducin family protein [Actinomycetota bacterium]|nr:class II aldolase/adducin family protein [Actinomycetota bacterium]